MCPSRLHHENLIKKEKKMNDKRKPQRTDEWKVERLGESQLVLTLPNNINITDDNVTIDDVLTAIANHNTVKKGRVIAKCCSANLMMS